MSLISELISSINQQKAGVPLPDGEKRFPNCLLESYGKKILAIPSRLFYMTDEAISGYHEQRKSSNLASEGLLLENSFILNNIKSRDQRVHLVDVGGGDGLRALNIVGNLLIQGTSVRYTCIDGSPNMIEMNRNNFLQTGITWAGKCIRFENFRGTKLDRSPNELQVVLFLGNNYGNFSVDDVADLLSHPNLNSDDLVIIGTDTPRSSIDGDFIINEFEKYSDDRMRMAVLKKLGLRRDELLDLYQYNSSKYQIEVYSLVKSSPSDIAFELNVEKGDIFLANVARRPPVEVLREELSPYFEVDILHDRDVDATLSLAICSPLGS